LPAATHHFRDQVIASLKDLPLFGDGINIATQWVLPGTAVLEGRTMDPKITILFLLIGAVIVLASLTDGNLERLWRQVAERGWRGFVPTRRRS
jgi:hypothetical protein